jgi:hypothetical protein
MLNWVTNFIIRHSGTCPQHPHLTTLPLLSPPSRPFPYPLPFPFPAQKRPPQIELAGLGERCELLQQVRAEPGHQTLLYHADSKRMALVAIIVSLH